MNFPGPPLVLWAIELAATALYAVIVGEAVRGPLSTRVPFFRPSGVIERALLDFYLGGAVFYVLASLPFGLFGTPLLLATMFLAGVSLVPRLISRRAEGPLLPAVGRALRSPSLPYVEVAVAAAVVLTAIELAAAAITPTGNTWDSSVDSLFVGLLQLHGDLPWRLSPVSPSIVAYPQGSTVWFGFAQTLWSLPPARTVLLVTPLFLGLAPLAGFTLGRRVVGTDSGGAVFALALAAMGPGTRYLVGGSNDFALAFPLVLLLAGRALDWARTTPPSFRDAIAFGAMLGYSAALNPVGAEWIALLLPVLAATTGLRSGAEFLRWIPRWAVAVGVGVVWVLPSLLAVVQPGTFPSTVLSGVPFTTSAPRYVGLVDPFLFRANDVALAPDALLRGELALLLVAGLVLLVGARGGSFVIPGSLGRWSLSGGVSAGVWLAVGFAADARVVPFSSLGPVTSAGEMSLLLFTLYGLLASVALVALAAISERSPTGADASSPPSPVARAGAWSGPAFWRRRSPAEQRLLAVALSAALLVPGAAFSAVRMPGVLGTLYESFSNVTADDFAMLDWARTHLPAGAHVLVAPGSAAEFLPAYDPHLVILFPMVGPQWTTNSSYLDLVHWAVNGSLGPNGTRDLSSLGVQYVAVTGSDTVLFPAFSLRSFPWPQFCALFGQGDAQLLVWTAAPGAPACGIH